jgi:hypothetical protein
MQSGCHCDSRVHSSESFWGMQELLSSLTLLGYLKRSKVKVNSAPGQYSPSWEVYSLEKKGKDHLISGRELRLAVPQSLRKAEEEQEAKKQQKFEELQRAGIDLTQIPEAELASGDGEVLKCHVSSMLFMYICCFDFSPFYML